MSEGTPAAVGQAVGPTVLLVPNCPYHSNQPTRQ